MLRSCKNNNNYTLLLGAINMWNSYHSSQIRVRFGSFHHKNALNPYVFIFLGLRLWLARTGPTKKWNRCGNVCFLRKPDSQAVPSVFLWLSRKKKSIRKWTHFLPWSESVHFFAFWFYITSQKNHSFPHWIIANNITSTVWFDTFLYCTALLS